MKRCKEADLSLFAVTAGLAFILTLTVPAQTQAVGTSCRTRVEDGAALVKRAAALEAAGKFEQAGETYDKAAKAFEAAGQRDQQAKALGKSAAMYEKLADQINAGGKRSAQASETATPAVPARQAAPQTAQARVVKLPPLAPKPGYIIGRAVFEDGRPVPKFTVWAAGYEGTNIADSHSVPSLGTVQAGNGRYALQTRDTFRHERPVNATVVGVHAVANIAYQGKNYLLEMYPLDGKTNGTDSGDFRGNSGKGVVRDFMLKTTGLRPGFRADEETQGRFPLAYYGGVLQLDGSVSAKQGINYEDATSLTNAFPTGRVEITLTPKGPLLDGSAGQTLQTIVPIAAFRLGGNWRLRLIRNIPLGVYTATARLLLPGGETRPLHVRPDIRPTFSWQPFLTVTWTPQANASLPDQLSAPTLYIGQ